MNILIQLLIKRYDPEFQYLAYLLYDLLSNEKRYFLRFLQSQSLFLRLNFCNTF